MLEHMIDDDGDIGTSGSVPDAPATDERRHRLHKLAGAAGFLGAEAIHDLAIDAEAAFREGDDGRLATSMAMLSTQFRQLHDSAAPFFRTDRKPALEGR
jgi:HPt (histidine-containing phosphotransfer) domain-containing protein